MATILRGDQFVRALDRTVSQRPSETREVARRYVEAWQDNRLDFAKAAAAFFLYASSQPLNKFNAAELHNIEGVIARLAERADALYPEYAKGEGA